MPRALVALTLWLAAAAAHAAPITVFDGSGLPQNQGWTVFEFQSGPYPFFTDGDSYDMNTIGLVPGNDSTLVLWQKNVGITVAGGFKITFELRVLDDTVGHNFLDAPIAFLARSQGGNYRSQMLYFDEDEIGWADDTQAFAMDTTDDFHVYKLVVDPTGTASVYVDGDLALTRTGFTANKIIAFGDQTNDLAGGPDVDGHFKLRSITVESDTPEPPALALTALAGALVAARRRA